MFYFMLLPLLLMGMSVSSGHSIKKLEINNKTEVDVYEIKEDAATNTVAFVNPKADKPTLREIVYYHVIERPYRENEGRVRYDSEEGPEIDETMRPFTNSHGFPFLESVEKELDVETENELKEDVPEAKEEYVIKDIPQEEEEVVYEVIYDEVEDLPVVDKTTKKEEIQETPTTVASEILKEISSEAKVIETNETVTQKPEPEVSMVKTSSDLEMTTQSILIEETTQAETITETQTPTTPVTEEPVLEKKAKTARKLLFDRVKERYYSKLNTTQNSTTPSERRKRGINMHFPEAPKLGELNFDSLPSYLRKLMSTEKPKTKIYSDSESEEEERLEDIRHRMNKLVSSLKTADTPEEEAPKPRTYGMNLTADSGYVWNDMAGPGIHYNVEASESIEDEVKDEDNHKKELENDHGHHDDEYKVTSESLEDNREKGRKRNKNKEKDDTIDQLMESDKFWTWLADWTSVYMDVLADHIKEVVHQEVVAEIKTQAEEHKKNDKEPVEQKEMPKEPVKENDLDKSESEDKDTEKHDVETTTPEPVNDGKVTEHKKSNSDNQEEKADDKNEEDLLKRRKDIEEKKKNETSIDNVKEEKNNDTREEGKTNKESTKIEAQNVYGNTIGGEKVTNIFIFYPNQDPDKILQDISKLNDSNKVNIEIRPNVHDENKKDEVPKKDESTQAPIEKKKDDVTSESPKKETPTTDTPKDIEEKTTELVMSTTKLPEATTVTQDQMTTENEPTTESSKVESTTKLEKQEETPKDKIEDSTKEDNSDSEKDVVENKSSESEKEKEEKQDLDNKEN